MKYKYEFETNESFNKGCCDACPFSYIDYEIDYGFNPICVLHASYDECPLEEVNQ